MKFKKISFKTFSYIFLRVLTIGILIWALLDFLLNKNDSAQGRSLFVAIQSFLLLICTTIVPFIEKKMKIDIPSFLEVIFLAFATCHMLLGEINDFYVKFSWWDSMLHTISGALIGIVGLSFLSLLNKNTNIPIAFSPVFVCIFVICFALACGAVWEIIEFWADEIAFTNMQRYKKSLPPFENFIGHEALRDTMKDLMLDLIGATIIGVLGYFDAKNKKGWFSKWTFVKISNIKLKDVDFIEEE